MAASEPMRGDERFRIGSVTKTFVAALILALAERGALALDDPLERWLEVPVPNAETTTVRHLLTHTSGLANYIDDPRVPLLRLGGAPHSPAELLAIAGSQSPLFAPGERFSYSNSNFIALGLIAEAAGSAPLAELLHRLVIAPLALEHTELPPTPAIAGRYARGYVDPDDPRLAGRPEAKRALPPSLDVTDADPAEAWASGAIVSTLDDVCRFFSAYLGGELLAPEATGAITTVAFDREGRATVSGIGVVRVELECGPAWGKGGEVPGYVTRVAASGDGSVVAVAMLNRSGPPAIEQVISLSTTGFCLGR